MLKTLASELRDASQRLESAQNQLHQLANTDPLTGCHNRRFYEEVIDDEVQRHQRHGLPLTVVFIDVDRVKEVNDGLGHAMGDRLIQQVARLLKRHVRADDFVFRWGGDEFLILMTCGEAEAQRKGTRLKQAFAGSVRRWGLPLGVGLSIGCAELGRKGSDIGALIQTADDRMYDDKHHPRSAGTRRKRRATTVPEISAA